MRPESRPSYRLIEKNKPELAEVSKVTSEPYDSDVWRTIEVAMLCSFVQLNKTIPLLMKIQENTAIIPQISEDIKAVRKNTDTIPQVLEEIKGMREDIQPGYRDAFQTGTIRCPSDKRTVRDALSSSFIISR
jgi:hypothetical protein